MKKILVTGGTGFIGSNLCAKLISEGYYVICLDNNVTGSLENVKELRSNMNFEFIRHDITNPINLEVDQIYHLACPASPDAYQENPIKTIKTNILGTLNVLGLAKRTKATFLLTSTSEVYGDPKISPQVEEYWGNVNPIGIRSCYDEGKRLAEALTFEYYRTHNVDIKIARLFNTYGLNMNPKDGRVISNFIVQALRNESITIYGDGSQARTFCFIDDHIDATINSFDKNLFNNDVVNIGTNVETTILDLAKLIIMLTNSKSKIINLPPLKQGDMMRRQPDVKKMKSLLGREFTSLELGIQKTNNF